MIQGARFPVNQAILEDMKSLSGGELVACNRQGVVSYSTLRSIRPGSHFSWNGMSVEKGPFSESRETKRSEEGLREFPGQFFTGQKQISGQAYLISKVQIDQLVVPGSNQIFVLFSQSDYQDLWWESAQIPLMVGLLAIPVSVLLIVFVSAEVTRPLKKLRRQVQQIAEGDWTTVQTSGKGDEIDELATSVNQMATRLAELEKQIRENERLGVLFQMGNGIAHNLRNSATGCRMAIEMHRMQLEEAFTPTCNPSSQKRNTVTDQDDLEIAVGQLKLMEKYIQRFLALRKTSEQPPKGADCSLKEVTSEVLGLLAPGARHQGIRLTLMKEIPEEFRVLIDDQQLEQVLINLLTNAMEATGQDPEKIGSQVALSMKGPIASSEGKNGRDNKVVLLDWIRRDREVSLIVWDNGPGPNTGLKDQLFDSFVSDKSGGIGLGLYVTRQIVESYGGTIGFKRTAVKELGEGTSFEVTLGMSELHVEHADVGKE